jgi:cytochrome c peroxidase
LASRAFAVDTPLTGHLLGLPEPGGAGSRSSQPLRQLGERLFSDPRLSTDGKVSCRKCHEPRLSFTDGRVRSVGHEGKTGARNAPSLINVAYQDSLFWDGRAADLESQALAPLTNPMEHALPSEQSIAQIVRTDPTYERTFLEVFGVQAERIEAAHVAKALSAYERTLLAGGSPFDRYAYGHDPAAMPAAAVRGLGLFRGRAQCSSCHPIGQSSALFTDGQFHMAPGGLPDEVSKSLPVLTRKVAQAAAVGSRVALERLIATDAGVAALGRFVVTLNPADIGKFKTPSLRNVSLTAPYMHDGSVDTLERAVDEELYSRGGGVSHPIALTVSERHDLVEFLRALVSAYIAPAPPS